MVTKYTNQETLTIQICLFKKPTPISITPVKNFMVNALSPCQATFTHTTIESGYVSIKGVPKKHRKGKLIGAEVYQ